MGSSIGAIKTAATRVGCSLAEYRQRVADGLRWCAGCKEWHPLAAFGVDASRSDGLGRTCLDRRSKIQRERYIPTGRKSRAGHRFVEARDGDKKQARGRVNALVSSGIIPNANAIPCHDCGHIGRDRRHEYDHHLGYAAEHHEDVEPVCTVCHHRRSRERGEDKVASRARGGRGRFVSKAAGRLLDGCTWDELPEVGP